MSEDVFEPTYSPAKIEFWQEHFEELDTLVHSPKSSAHIAEHLAREWFLLQARQRACLCKELHAHDSRAVDPACAHEPSGGGGFRAGQLTAVCIVADLRRAADQLPPHWAATHRIWSEQGISTMVIEQRSRRGSGNNFEPAYSRSAAVRMMARALGWTPRAESVA